MFYIVSKLLNHPSKDACKIDLEIIHKLDTFGIDFGLFWDHFLVHFGTKNRLKKGSKIGSIFGSIFKPILVALGPQNRPPAGAP